MRKTLVTATLLLFGAGAASVAAKDNVALKGSDTLETLTEAVLAACPGAKDKGITYDGGGSTTIVGRNKRKTLRLLNQPSDGSQRSVADAINVLYHRPER